jgi:small ligand-binding sensory domain FIST
MSEKAPVACAAALSTTRDAEDAIAEVSAEVLNELGAAPDLALLFVSPHHLARFQSAVEQTSRELNAKHLLACSAESIVGTGTEVEQQPAIALWGAVIPETKIVPMHLSYEQTIDGGSIQGWPDDLPDQWPDTSLLLVLADPFSFPADSLLGRINEDQPGAVIVGGNASAAHAAGGNRLAGAGSVWNHGAVAVHLRGGLRVRTVVSQGCRPIGNPFVITRAHGNVIQELGGRPAFERLKEVYDSLANRERRMLQQGLHLGRVVNEYQDRFEQGDFLVRNVIGLDESTGFIAVGDSIRVGQTVQFHVRDAETADADLRQLLARDAQNNPPPAGALLFTCNGRGSRLFTEPNHDATAVAHAYSTDLPVAGFFAAGEIGPVGGKNFLHGFTASIAFFERTLSHASRSAAT